MLVKTIRMQNFRQYKDVTIDFAQDSNKNVTIIMGDNGTGKTTLAQAFQWVLYEQTTFKVKELINRQVRETLTLGKQETIVVALDVIYNNQQYTIKRTKTVVKHQSTLGDVGGALTISYLAQDGQVKYLPPERKNYLIKQMLPQNLSKFFFFDGERIENMANQINEGKSKDFKEAVESLVGLVAIQNAITHFKPTVQNTVIRRYTDEIEKNNSSTEKMKQLNEAIALIEKEISDYENSVQEKQGKINEIEKKLNEDKELLFSMTSQMKLKEDYGKAEKRKENLIRQKNQKITNVLLRSFDMNLYEYMVYPICKKVNPLLKETGDLDKSIPKLTKDTLTFLLERQECLCGAHLEVGEEAYKRVYDLLEYVPPKTIGMLISEFEKNAGLAKKHSDFWGELKTIMDEFEQLNADIQGVDQNLSELYGLLANTDEGDKAKNRIKVNEEEKKKLEKDMIDLVADIKNKQGMREHKKTEKDNLVVINDDSMRYVRLKMYAERIYHDYVEDYSKKEISTRERLETRINEIFKKIYDGNISIEVDEKYRIRVNVVDEFAADDEIEKNTAQQYAIIFAFIAAIIDLAKEKSNSDAVDEEDKIDMENEGYPLVMDAPLSAFDKKRIKKICEEIPKIADQVVMFIKDTDGEIAEKQLGDKIGCKYIISKVNDSNLHSTIERCE